MATLKNPIVMDMQPGEYWWCSCGESAKQPFCDGAHKTKNTGMAPLHTVIEKPGKVAWCGCKASAKKPFCDGSHLKI
ncbi:MAG: CDGSH iron-sulfur domain-containing protein [Candidatus Omnitrophota bacterium]